MRNWLKLPGFARRTAGKTPPDPSQEGPKESAGPAEPNRPKVPSRPKEPEKPEKPPEPPATPGSDEAGASSRRTWLLRAGALALAAAVGVAIGLLLAGDGEQGSGQSPAPTVVVRTEPESATEAAEELGFPAFATLNTTRVGGPDPTANAAGVALATYPSVGGTNGPEAVIMAAADDWQGAIAAASLTADPIGAPVLLGSPDELPGFTADALSGLAPKGIRRGAAKGTQVIAIGDVLVPDGLETLEVDGQRPAELAAAIDRERPRLGGAKDPQHILVVPSEEAPMAMPAAAWAARSGDPIVFAAGDNVPAATTDVLERHPDAPVYVLGPESSIGAGALRKLKRASDRVLRIQGPDPVTNSIAFARFVDGSFGWNINDPGHGFTIASSKRPADAAAAAPLSASGKPGPLLLTDRADRPPPPMRNFLLDTKPGYADDPSRALYNHVWLLGDTSVISLGFQAQVDKLVALERVSPGRGLPEFGPAPGTAEQEPSPGRSRNR